LRGEVGEEVFGLPEADVDLDALELEEILADMLQVSKGKAKAVEISCICCLLSILG